MFMFPICFYLVHVYICMRRFLNNALRVKQIHSLSLVMFRCREPLTSYVFRKLMYLLTSIIVKIDLFFVVHLKNSGIDL